MMIGFQVSTKAIQFISIKACLTVCAFGIIFANFTIKYFRLSDELVLMIFLMEAMMFGIQQNLVCILQNTIIEPKYRSVSFELNYSMGLTTCMICPAIAQMAEPIPSIYLSVMLILGVIVLPMIKVPSNQDEHCLGETLGVHQSLISHFVNSQMLSQNQSANMFQDKT